MDPDQSGSRPFPPWRLAAGSATALTVSLGPAVQFSFAVFLKPLCAAFGVDRATMSLAPATALLLAAVATPLVGLLTDRFSPRTVVLLAVPLTALAFLLLGILARSPVTFIILYGLVGITATGFSPVPFAKAIAVRFTRRRGLALGVAMLGIGVGTAFVPATAQALLVASGWRAAYLGLAVLVLIIAFPSALLCLSRDRQPMEAARAPTKGMTASAALKDHVFWKVGFAFTLVAMASAGVMAHLVAVLTDRGVSQAQAAIAISLGGFAMIVGRLVSGYLLDRIFAPHVVLGFFAAPLAGLLVLLVAPSAAAGWISTVLIGLGFGAEVDLVAYLVSRYMGQRAFGTIYGYLFAMFMVGNSLGPVVMGLSYTKTGDYRLALVGLSILIAFSIILVSRLGSYRHATHGVGEASLVASADSDVP